MVVTPSSILTSTTQVPDVELSLDEGSNEVLEDSDDEPVIKIRVSDSDDAFDDEPDTEAIGTRFRSLFSLISLLFLLFLAHPFICLACYLITQP